MRDNLATHHGAVAFADDYSSSLTFLDAMFKFSSTQYKEQQGDCPFTLPNASLPVEDKKVAQSA